MNTHLFSSVVFEVFSLGLALYEATFLLSKTDLYLYWIYFTLEYRDFIYHHNQRDILCYDSKEVIRLLNTTDCSSPNKDDCPHVIDLSLS